MIKIDEKQKTTKGTKTKKQNKKKHYWMAIKITYRSIMRLVSASMSVTYPTLGISGRELMVLSGLSSEI